MDEEIKKSSFFSLDEKDFIKGLIMAVLGSIVGYANSAFQTGLLFPIDWAQVGGVAGSAFTAYLLKNLFTDHKDKFLKKTKK